MKIRDVIRHMGRKSILAFFLVFLLVFTATSVGGMLIYRSTKKGLLNRGALNAVKAAKEFDRYLLVRKNAVLLAGSAVDDMMRGGLTAEEILPGDEAYQRYYDAADAAMRAICSSVGLMPSSRRFVGIPTLR